MSRSLCRHMILCAASESLDSGESLTEASTKTAACGHDFVGRNSTRRETSVRGFALHRFGELDSLMIGEALLLSETRVTAAGSSPRASWLAKGIKRLIRFHRHSLLM
ncbi:uncharacterized protein B0I36DRAFT_89424 [Microdochium trichocladiopsis]|uniref:Uncharacterized protein n=1 Tax=Microdochium trichocladiopsis TaxID=1682393 RepID=A0A9P8YB11_9PEZI|nr:uncharacterized protein B0I36DRAFT_89424 [Microdochium trichocladiopsis]KAH7035198.1 hypothetical protein B0I36DRAFT_89424 [Microdochium trichocladiopsis]